MAGIFHAGFSEFARLRSQQAVEPRAVVEGAQRVMRVVLSREMDSMETHLSFIATVGSTTPDDGMHHRVAFEEILARFPDYQVDEANLEWSHNNNVRGYAKVPMRL